MKINFHGMQRIMDCKIHCHLGWFLPFLIVVTGSVYAQTTVVLNAVKDNTLYRKRYRNLNRMELEKICLPVEQVQAQILIF